jgi:hypothetical protein
VLPYCNGVDLTFLNIARFEPAQRAEDPTAEDSHCQRMKMLGAWKFGSVEEYNRMSWLEPEKLDKKILVVAAWPQNGIGLWVMTARMDQAAGKGYGRLWNAFNMDERCEAVKDLGGKFYDNPKDCPELGL